MKEWFTWLFVIAGLLFVVAFRPDRRSNEQAYQPPHAPPSAGQIHRLPEHPAVPRAPAPRPSFGEYPCSSLDCSEHKAGFRWAEEHVITDPDSCTGNSGAFVEGCRVYAEQRAFESWIDPSA